MSKENDWKTKSCVALTFGILTVHVGHILKNYAR